MEEINNNEAGQQPVSTAEGRVATSRVRVMFEKLEMLLEWVMVKKIPIQIPIGGKNLLVAVTPYIAIVIIAKFIFIAPIMVAIMPFAMLAGGIVAGTIYSILALTSFTSFVLVMMAIPGLFKRTLAAWKKLFQASTVGLFAYLIYALTALFSEGSIHGVTITFVGAAIGWYLIFQVKEMYKS